MQKYYFTFGCSQPHENHYHIIEADDPAKARELMFRRFGDKWSMMYDSAEAAGVERWNLTQLK